MKLKACRICWTRWEDLLNHFERICWGKKNVVSGAWTLGGAGSRYTPLSCASSPIGLSPWKWILTCACKRCCVSRTIKKQHAKLRQEHPITFCRHQPKLAGQIQLDIGALGDSLEPDHVHLLFLLLFCPLQLAKHHVLKRVASSAGSRPKQWKHDDSLYYLPVGWASLDING